MKFHRGGRYAKAMECKCNYAELWIGKYSRHRNKSDFLRKHGRGYQIILVKLSMMFSLAKCYSLFNGP